MYFRDRHPYIFNEGTDLISLCSRERDKKKTLKNHTQNIDCFIIGLFGIYHNRLRYWEISNSFGILQPKNR